MHSNNNIENHLKEELPDEIQGYTRRSAVFKDFATIMYSKDGNYLLKNLVSNSNRINDINEFSKNLLYEVWGKDLYECFKKMKLKIELNEKVKKEFPNNIILQFSPNQKLIIEEVEYFYKIFEIYLVLDTNSDSQFFAVVTLEPLNEYHLILNSIEELTKKIRQKSLINLSSEDFNFLDFNLPNCVHFFNSDFENNKEKLRQIFKQKKWNIKFKDNYYFEKIEILEKTKTILCEGNNFKILNKLKLDKIIFSNEHNSVSIFQNIKTNERYALRDKDYLLNDEIKKLQNVFKKYYILNYYCIENYLYHPENINEIQPNGFNKMEYINDIIKSKNLVLDDITLDLKLIRTGYKELTENHINVDKNNTKKVLDELKSNEFEIFYPHFNMKKIYKRDFLSKLHLTERKLASTKWFKKKINEVLTKNV